MHREYLAKLQLSLQESLASSWSLLRLSDLTLIREMFPLSFEPLIPSYQLQFLPSSQLLDFLSVQCYEQRLLRIYKLLHNNELHSVVQISNTVESLGRTVRMSHLILQR